MLRWSRPGSSWTGQILRRLSWSWWSLLRFVISQVFCPFLEGSQKSVHSSPFNRCNNPVRQVRGREHDWPKSHRKHHGWVHFESGSPRSNNYTSQLSEGWVIWVKWMRNVQKLSPCFRLSVSNIRKNFFSPTAAVKEWTHNPLVPVTLENPVAVLSLHSATALLFLTLQGYKNQTG